MATTFTATPVNGGAAPSYEWFVNGVSQGAPSLSNTFTTSTLTNGQVVTCRMTSNATNCPLPLKPISAGTTVTVNPSFPVSVSLAANPGTSVCAGTSVLFTATPTNGGASPLYEFFVNGISQGAASATPTFTLPTPLDLDLVKVVLTSSIPSCATGNPANASLTMNITTLTVSVALNPSTAICGGTPRTYTATPNNGGGSPLYEFFVNTVSQGLPSATPTFTYTPTNGDLVEVHLQSSLGGCASPNPAITSFTQTVNAPPTASITGSNTLCTGIPVLLNSNAAAGSGTISTIQWRLGGVNIGGATSATYVATAVGNYDVVVTNSNGCTVTSAVFTITASPSLMAGVYTIGAITATGASSVGTTVTVASTANLVVGAALTKVSGTGVLAANTVIASIVNGTTFTVNTAPTTALSGAALAGATCTNYISFLTAIADLNSRAISANCTFNVTAGYVENIAAQLALGSSAGPNLNGTLAGKSIVFQKSGVGANPIINAAYVGTRNPNSPDPDGIWSLNGIDNITIDGIDLNDNNVVPTPTATALSSGTTITVGSTAGITVGMTAGILSGAGVFAGGTTVASITDATHFVVSAVPTTQIGIGAILILNQTAAMEFGYGLFKLTNTDGAQNNTIKNCTITLNRVNVTAGAGPFQAGSSGIVVINATKGAATTALTAGGAAGANSSNKFYTNTIQNCNNGIVLSGLADVSPFTNADVSNDVGGVAVATGNNIINFGGGAGATLAAAGVIVNNQWSVNVSYNTINNNNGSGVNHVNILRGIYGQAGTSANATFNNNIISVNGGGNTQAVTGIENAIGSTAAANTVNINNNTITGSYATATTGAWTGITNTATPANLNMNFNTVQNVTLPGTGANTLIGIGSSAVFASGSTLKINNNSILNNTKTITGSPFTIALTPIAVTGLSVAGSIVEVKTNTISGNTVTGGSNTVNLLCISMAGASTITASDNIINNNSITGMSGATIATVQGYSNLSTSTNETVTNNSISNLFITGTSTGLHIINGIRNNTVPAAVRSVSNNTIYNLYTGSGLSAVITGIVSSSGTTVTLSKNKIYNLFPGQSATAGSIAKGISITTGTTVNVSNNMISIDLSLAAAATSSVAANSVLTGADAVRGIEMTSALAPGTMNLYYNSIRLAGNGGAGFGSSGIFHTTNATATTAALNLRNNIIDNENTPNGGLTVAYRRSSATLTNYAGTSNNNLFYAGTPSASRLIFNDGTNSDQTLAAYKTRVSARDAASVSDLPNFVSTTDLHLTLDNNCIANGQGAVIPGFTDDYDGDTRNATTPDLGFDEFAGTNPVSLTVTNPSGVCTGFTVDLTVAGVTAGSSGGTAFYYYTDAGGTTTLATPAAVAAGGTYYIKYGKGSCYSAITPVVVTINPNNTWLGVTTNWNDASNWCPGIPGVASDITIPGSLANYPIITSATSGTARNITIAAGASITTTGTGFLDVKGNLVNSGTIYNWGEIKLTGSVAQTFPGSAGTVVAMNKLTIANTSGANPAITLNKDLLIRDVITPTQGVVNLSNVYVTLRSVVDSTARVGTVGGSFTYTGTGNFVVERYFPGRRAWRLITAPVVNGARTIFNSWQAGGNNTLANAGNGTYVTGPGANPATNGLDVSPANNYSLKTFDYTTSGFNGVGNTKTTLLPGFPAGASASYLTDVTGFFVFVRGDRTINNPAPFDPSVIGNSTVLRDTGSIKAGAFTYNCNPGSGANIYTLVGNPYASPIDFASLTRSNLANKFTVWDPSLGTVGAYAVWNAGVVTPFGSVQTGAIQSKQAFVVEATGAAPTLTFGEAAKSAANNSLVFRPAPLPAASLAINLYQVNASGTDRLADGVLAQFNDEYAMGSDHMDALKFTNVNETFSIKNGNNYFIQDRRPFVHNADTIFFSLKRTKQMKYKFNVMIDAMMRQQNMVAYLQDKYLHTATPLNMQGNTWTDFEVTGDAASAAADRFFITFKKAARFNHIKADAVYSDVAVNWSVENAAVVDRYEVERSADGKVFEKVGELTVKENSDALNTYDLIDPGVAPGFYFYRVKAVSNSFTAFDYSEAVKVKVTRTKSELYVYPNPVTQGVINLRMNAESPEGRYAVRLINGNGQALAVQQLQHIKATGTEQISYPSYIAGGAYQLEVTSPDKKKTMINIVIVKQ